MALTKDRPDLLWYPRDFKVPHCLLKLLFHLKICTKRWESELNERKYNTWSSRGSYVLLLSARINSWDWWGQLRNVTSNVVLRETSGSFSPFPFLSLKDNSSFIAWGGWGAHLFFGGGGGSYSPLKDFKWGTVENWLLMRGDHRNTTELYGGIR